MDPEPLLELTILIIKNHKTIECDIREVFLIIRDVILNH